MDVLVEKRYGIRDRLVAGQKEFKVTVNARRILPEKTDGIWKGLVQRAYYMRNHTDSSAVGGSDM